MQVTEADRAEYQRLLKEVNQARGTETVRRIRNQMLEIVRRYPKRDRFEAHQLLWLGRVISA